MSVKINKRINDIIKRDSKVMLTTTRESFPFVPDHGDGDFIYDVAGNRFLDFSSFISVYNLGVNANKQIRNSIKSQVDKLSHNAFTDYYSERPVRFAEKLVRMMPRGFGGRVFFSNSGTEANEAAIKFAKIFTKRAYLMAFYGAFHGRTGGTLPLTASTVRHREHLGPFSNVIHAIYPCQYRNIFNIEDEDELSKACIDHIEKNILAKEYPGKEIAAIFIEPVQGEGGYIVPSKLFIKELRRIADENDIVLVSDEIQAGYMRTGKFLAMDNFGVQADIYTMAKALGGGMPFGATITRSSLGDIPSGSHSNTFGGNLIAIAAAEASLDYINRNMKNLQKGIRKKGAYVMRRLQKMKENFEIVGDVRGIGLMIGMELVKDKKSKTPAIEVRGEILKRCFSEGLVLLPAGTSTIRIIPPLTIDEKHLENGMDILEEVVRKVNAETTRK